MTKDEEVGTAPAGKKRRAAPRRTRGAGPATAEKARPAAPRFAKPLTVASMLGWTLLSVLVPGAAHLRAGHRRTGLALIGVYAAILVTVLAIVLINGTEVGVYIGWTTGITIALAAGALAWFALLLASYIALRPGRLSQMGQIVSGVAVGILGVAVMSPFALTAELVRSGEDAIQQIFPSGEKDPDIAPVKQEDPWNGRDRVNFLLVGGDGAGNREGVRTDSMTVASVHVQTGNTVLFSLPRNLQHVRFPPGTPMGKHFPNGFQAELPNGGLLNEVWQFANDNPQAAGGRNKGPRVLMDAIGHTLGLKIDYYALINMYGFAHLVDAIGGLKIRVDQDIKWGGLYGTAGTIKAGFQVLSGEEALWYGRSRVGSDDFSRMARQRCVIGAFAQQATPVKVLSNFKGIAAAAKRMASTNIPQDLLEHLVNLAVKVKGGRITSLQFVPPEFYSGRPDWVKIRKASAKAISDSLKPARTTQVAQASGGPGTASGTPSPSPTRTAAGPTQTPTRNTNKSAKSLSELCGL
ncbi:LCP family protein [Nonomuraea typhae]|uniref:LCP family protein n=1 Tax=Nonomuraea typhae TaxID=2603600 RepID=UPI001FE2E250|nr:LCP family protein [Nonomuraea typhae]